ncbi:hypothetical protein F7R91_07850 [Streptomyces luteolifulvus]|jgi:hypothetical protein|uniref:Uncharacterized protein n=1 Tax=Streptomyces luteolifulvus TaxID=2615112 RepID=A0A6H9V8B9_9ACTN|nr:hypothetical protein [Streptomyces luteolifulvus]KAB1148693.1 hypothetical protein F7R91_07850 [Streptomyces luteolifulvus]
MTTPMPGTRPQTRQVRTDLLGIYLNDHLAGSTVGAGRSLFMARSHRDPPFAEPLRQLAGEIAEDRASLLRIMRSLGVPKRRYKIAASGAVERLGRLKSNGRLYRRSPLTLVVELEFLRLGVKGKELGWRTLRALAEADGRFDEQELDGLIARAERQMNTLEELRVRAVQDVLLSG